MNTRMLVDDNGHSHHKLAWVDENQKIRTSKCQSIIGPGDQGMTKTDGSGFVDTYEVDGRRFVCHPQQDQPTDLRNATYQTSEETKVLTVHSMTQAGLPIDASYHLGVTLPLNQYFRNDGSKNEALIKKVKDLYISGNKVKSLSDQKTSGFADVSVYAEGMCAFYDWLLLDDGQMKGDKQSLALAQGSIVVVDIGGSTTDIVTFVLGGSLATDHKRSGTLKKGVMDAKHLVRGALEEIMDRKGFNSTAEAGIPQFRIDEAFTRKKMQFCGEEYNLEAEVNKACREVSLEILSFVKTKIGNVLAHQAIIFVGGGAIAFKDYIKEQLPNTEFLDEFANARGALKYMIASRKAQRGAA